VPSPAANSMACI